MNRKNVIEWVFYAMAVTVVLSLLVIQSEQKKSLEETLIEKENVISDMETQLIEQLSINEDLGKEMEAVNLQLAEVLESFKETKTKVEELTKENQALHSQNETLAKQVSALEYEAKKKQAEASKSKTTVMPSRNNNGSSVAKEFYVEATAYTAYCAGCSGKTATGINLRANPDLKVIAVDPKVIPLGSKVWVEGYGYAVAGDTGGAIKGNKIDVFIPTKSAANQWGRKTVRIKVLN